MTLSDTLIVILAAINRTREQCKQLIELINSMQSMQKRWLFEVVGRTVDKYKKDASGINSLRFISVCRSGDFRRSRKLWTGERVNKDLTCQKGIYLRKKNFAKDTKIKLKKNFPLHYLCANVSKIPKKIYKTMENIAIWDKRRHFWLLEQWTRYLC